MREIKFRGKTEDDMIFEDGKMIDKGTWVYGSLIVNGNLPYIVGEVIESDSEYISLEYWYPCDKSTIGQFTGLHDKNGKEIYEGDMVIHTSFPRDKQEVRFKNGCFIVNQMALYSYHNSVIEIIGNIHDKGEIK